MELSACSTRSSFVIPVQAQEELLSDMDIIVKAIEFNGSVLVAHNDEIILNKSYGMANNKINILNTPLTRFYIASVTKQFTAMAILILQEQGKLDLQDRISKYFPDYPIIWQEITIHHLLTHTSGLQPAIDIDQFKNRPLAFQPGTEWDYTDTGYIVLGYIIEQVSNQSYKIFLKENIFIPLNMSNTGYGNNQNNQAVGYVSDFIIAEVIDWSQFFYTDAAGGLYSTTEDLYKWNQALSTDRLISKKVLKEMFIPHVPTHYYSGMSYGYGWFVGKRFNHRVAMHTGTAPGFATINVFYPEDNIHIIALSNQHDGSTLLFYKTIEDYLFDE